MPKQGLKAGATHSGSPDGIRISSIRSGIYLRRGQQAQWVEGSAAAPSCEGRGGGMLCDTNGAAGAFGVRERERGGGGEGDLVYPPHAIAVSSASIAHWTFSAARIMRGSCDVRAEQGKRVGRQPKRCAVGSGECECCAQGPGGGEVTFPWHRVCVPCHAPCCVEAGLATARTGAVGRACGKGVHFF